MLINSKYYEIPKTSDQPHMGDNVRLVIYSPKLTSDEEELLFNILAASKLESTEFLHIITPNVYFPLKDYANSSFKLKLISFGCPLTQIGLQVEIKKYQRFKIRNTEVVEVDTLADIGEEKMLKKYIWSLLKEWFLDE